MARGTTVVTTLQTLSRIRQHYNADTKYLFRILLNATSVVEANIALDLLLKTVPERDLASAINMREVIKSLPASPFTMPVDEQTLVKVAGLRKNLAALERSTIDGYDIVVTTAGNLVLDLIVKHEDEKYFWTPVPRTSDFVSSELIDHIIGSDFLLPNVVDLVQDMGLVFNPTIFLSIDDWHLDYAAETMQDLGDLF